MIEVDIMQIHQGKGLERKADAFSIKWLDIQESKQIRLIGAQNASRTRWQQNHRRNRHGLLMFTR